MATMGVRINSSGGDNSLSLANTLAKAFWGDPDFEIKLAKMRSDLATDEYGRRLTQASTDWTRSRQALTDAELAARTGGGETMGDIMEQDFRRKQEQAAAAANAPAPVDLSAVTNAPIPASTTAWPAPVPVETTPIQVGETAIPTPTPRPTDTGNWPPAPVEVPYQEPDFRISGYPVRSDTPETAPVPQPSVDEAMLRLQPPPELAPGGRPTDTGTLQAALQPNQNLSGLPPELQPVPVQGSPAPEPFAGTITQVPGRSLTEMRDFQGPPVPVEAQPAGPPTATGEPLPEGAPAPSPQAMPGTPVMADVQGSPVPPPEAPAVPATSNRDIVAPSIQAPLQPGETKPNPQTGGVTVGTPAGDLEISHEQFQKIGALLSFTSDPAGQMGKMRGGIGIMDQGPNMENVTLYSGGAVPRSSVLGIDAEIRLEQEKAKLAPLDLKKNVITEGGRTEELYVGPNGQIAVRQVPGGQPADAMGGTSDTQTFLRNIRDTALAMNQPEAPITPDQAMNYELAYNSMQKPSYDWQDVPPSAEYPNGGKARIPVPPMDLSQYPTPAQVRARAGLPAAAAQPASAPAPAQPPAPAPAPAQPGAVPAGGVVSPDIVSPAVQAPGAQPAPAPAAPAPPPSPPTIPGNKPLDPNDPRSGPAVGTQPNGQVLGTSGGMIILPKGPKERSEFQARSWLWLNEAAHANMMMKTMTPPDWFQDWLLDPQREDPSMWNAFLKAKASSDETRQFMAASAGFINSEGRINSGATIMNPENINFGYRFIDKTGDNETTKMLKADNRKVALDSIYDAMDVSGLITPQMLAQLKAYGYERNAPLPSQQAGQPNVIDYNPAVHGR